MSFKSVIGQGGAVNFLTDSISGKKVSHAYMFIGPGGVGKKMAALNFAKALNCLDPKGMLAGGENVDACDTCAQCRKIDAFGHPDVTVISPDKESSGLGIDKIRAITKDISLKPYEGRKKVYILDHADSMRHEAQNALLKTLEEPPSDSVIILIVENINYIFSTVQSRAKRVRFFPLPSEAIEKILVEKHGLDKDDAGILSRVSAGSPGRALIYKEEDFFGKRTRLINSLKHGSFLDSDVDRLSKTDLKVLLEVMLTWYRDILVAKAGGGGTPGLINADRCDDIHNEAGHFSFKALDNIITQIVLTGSFLEQNLNPKLAMGVLGINLMER